MSKARMLTSDMWYISTYDDGTFGVTLVDYSVAFDPMSPQRRFKNAAEAVTYITATVEKKAEEARK